MATSGTYAYTRNRDEIINMAFDLLGLKGEGMPISDAQIQDAAKFLNLFVKSIVTRGINLWRYEELTVFPVVGKQKYNIGTGGDHAANNYVKSELSVAAISGASTITVDSATGMLDGDNIGIELDSNTIQWTTINGAPSGNVITLSNNISSAAAIDNHVYTYTNIARRPLLIMSGRYLNENNAATVIGITTRQEYFDLPDKDTQGVINQFYYNPSIQSNPASSYGELYIWPTFENTKSLIQLTTQRALQDLTNGSDNIDFPQEWELGIVMSLAELLLMPYGDLVNDRTAKTVREKSIEFIDMIEAYDEESGYIQMQPDYGGF